MTTPAVNALRQRFPESTIHFLTKAPCDQVLERNEYIDKLFLSPSKDTIKEWASLLRNLRREKYSVVIDFHGIPKTAILSWITAANTRIGLRSRGRSPFYTHPVTLPDQILYSPLRKMALLTALDIPLADYPIEYPITQADRDEANSILNQLKVDKSRPLISVSPVSRKDYKVWPAKKFAAICDFLVETFSAQILFLWGPGESNFVNDVREETRHPTLPDYDIPSLSETVALLERVDLHVGNDNGPMHFAIAASIPTVAIFGRPKAVDWTPPNQTRHLAAEYDPGCKNSCAYPKCQLECLNGVSVELVKRKILELIERENPLKEKSQNLFNS